MAYVLFDQGKRLGEVSEWTVENQAPVYKNVLGKTVLSTPANDECRFVSPKPVNRRSKLVIIENGQQELVLELKSVKGATNVVAKIVSSKKL